MQNTNNFETLVDNIQYKFDQVVEQGSDQDLFVAGYLSGHFSLVVSQCQLQGQETVEALNLGMLASLDKAFADGELEETDQQDVKTFWANCL